VVFLISKHTGLHQSVGVEKTRSGVLAAIMAYFMWGVLPIFWKQLGFLPPLNIVAQRTVWSLLVLLPVIALMGEWRRLIDSLRSPASAGWLLLSGFMIGSNWLIYVWATLNHHIIEGALGYYLNPFLNMLFGTLWFGERHNRAQIFAMLLALGGVLIQVVGVGHIPWIALALATTFSLYAVIRKRTPHHTLTGLTAETALLAPIGLVWLIHSSASVPAAFGNSWGHTALILSMGVVTVIPLFFFGYAAKTIRLTTLGILQFIGPSIQFFIGWKLYGEVMSSIRLVSFSLIWLAISIYTVDSIRTKGIKRNTIT